MLNLTCLTPAMAGIPFATYEILFKEAQTPARWPADFMPLAYGHCEMAFSSGKDKIRDLQLGICALNLSGLTYESPCYLENSAVSYGFRIPQVTSIKGYTILSSGPNLSVTTPQGLVIARYRVNRDYLVFNLGTSDIAYGFCRH